MRDQIKKLLREAVNDDVLKSRIKLYIKHIRQKFFPEVLFKRVVWHESPVTREGYGTLEIYYDYPDDYHGPYMDRLKNELVNEIEARGKYFNLDVKQILFYSTDRYLPKDTHRYYLRKVVDYDGKDLMRETKSKSQFKKIINCAEAFEILDSTAAKGCDWGEGGCWILADALVEYYNAPLYCVYNSKYNHVEHFVIKTGRDIYLDYDGFRSSTQIFNEITRFTRRFTNNDLMICPYRETLNTPEIVRDQEASKRLVDLFNRLSL
jgi:hypothetical protein